MRIDICFWGACFEDKWYSVNAEPLPQLDAIYNNKYHFALHRVWNNSPRLLKGYTVSNIETGLQILRESQSLKRSAIAMATDILAKVDESLLARSIEASLCNHPKPINPMDIIALEE